MGTQHFDLKAAIELTDVADLDALPMNGFAVAFDGSLGSSHVQQIDEIRMGNLGLLSELSIALDVIIYRRMADTRLSTGHHFGPAHRVVAEPIDTPSDCNARAHARGPLPALLPLRFTAPPAQSRKAFVLKLGPKVFVVAL